MYSKKEGTTKSHENSRSLIDQVDSLMKEGKYQETIHCLDKMIEANPKDKNLWSKKGVILTRLRLYDDAIKCFNEAVQIDPKFEDVWYKLGGLLLLQGNHEKAEECFTWVLELNPNNSKAKKVLSSFSKKEDNGDNNQTILLKRKKIVFKPKEVDAYTDTGTTVKELVIAGRKHIRKKEFNEALECINKALKIDCKYSDAWSARGDVLLEMGKIDEASECFKKAMESSFSSTDLSKEWETLTKDNQKEEPIMTIATLVEEDQNRNSIKIEKVGFECPNCGNYVNLNEKICLGCSMIFKEEEFKNCDTYIDDDLVFFDKLNKILTVEKPIFVHMDNESGFITFLEKRKNHETGKTDYILVKGQIEKLGWDYSFIGKDFEGMTTS